MSDLRKIALFFVDNFIFSFIFSRLHFSSSQVADQWAFSTACNSKNKDIFLMGIEDNILKFIVDVRDLLHEFSQAILLIYHFMFMKDLLWSQHLKFNNSSYVFIS